MHKYFNLFDLKQKVTNQKKKLDEISNKFKEIKLLAIKYKDNKDIEIRKLHEELDVFKKTIEDKISQISEIGINLFHPNSIN